MDQELVATRSTYAGVFGITLSTLMYEILLTRIFSVTMWYHFAFMAISIAMFGMTVGALLVYLIPDFFTPQRTKYHLSLAAFALSPAIVFSFLTHLSVPFVVPKSLVALYALAFTYAVISLPFVFSGICVCLALTRFPRRVSQLYAADLAGAAAGCVLLIYTLKATDGPTAVIVVAFLAALGAVFFASAPEGKGLRRAAYFASLLLGCFALLNTLLLAYQSSLLPLIWVKGAQESPPLFEKWNSFSRVRVDGDPFVLVRPYGWGLSSTCPPDAKIRQLNMTIDASAATVMTFFSGDLRPLEYLKYDVTNLAHYIRPDSTILVVGTGGGRDVLSALAFGQKAVLGVEINDDIIMAVNDKFGVFTGHLNRDPRVTFVNDEARSYVARSKDRFDIIQISLIDTWAATAAGAFVLTENSLYTVEACRLFLHHLTPRGVLSFSRWYDPARPAEVYRLTSLAAAALADRGVIDPRRHIIIVRQMPGPGQAEAPVGVGTMLVGKEPFSENDLSTIEDVARRMKFDVILTPAFALDSTLATIASGKAPPTVMGSAPINIAAPTDDNPFFFHTTRLRDAFHPASWNQWPAHRGNAVFVLGGLLVIVVGLTLLCVVLPIFKATGQAPLRGIAPFLVFFASIGLGFMLVEISQMQRLIVFLGHPTYGLSVVLFALLLSSGLGSYATGNIEKERLLKSGSARMAVLMGALIVFGALTPSAIRVFQGATTPLRIVVATAILFPLGFLMGMAFPLGMKAAATHALTLTPWLWGINGATSVCASVLAVVIALGSGISAAYWTGFSCYGVALLAFIWTGRGST